MPRWEGKFLVQVTSAAVSMKVAPRGAMATMPAICQYAGLTRLPQRTKIFSSDCRALLIRWACGCLFPY